MKANYFHVSSAKKVVYLYIAASGKQWGQNNVEFPGKRQAWQAHSVIFRRQETGEGMCCKALKFRSVFWYKKDT